MSATVRARIAQDVNAMAHSSAMSARDQARFTPTEAAQFRIQASMYVASVTWDLGEYERLAQGFIGTCPDTSTATSRPRSMFDSRLGYFVEVCLRRRSCVIPRPLDIKLPQGSALTCCRVISPYQKPQRPYRCAGAPQMHSHRGGCTGRIDAVHTIKLLTRAIPNFRDIRGLIGVG
jgi:hypothetical protein